MRKGGQETGKGAMAEAWSLFDAGDVVGARHAARQVLARSPSGQEADEANDLLSRVRPPKQAYAYALIAACVLCAMILLALLRS
jgi:hypothetical protein